MADMITRCPSCSVAFRISDAHLKSAKGIVRCGSCLGIFNANEHLQLVNSGAASTPVPAPAPEPPPKPRSDNPESTTEDPDDELLFDDDFDDDELIFDGADDETYTDYRPASNLFESSESKHNAFRENADIEDADESWALELLKDDSDLDIKFRKIVTPDDRRDASPKGPADNHPPADTSADIQTEPLNDGRPSQNKHNDRDATESATGESDKTAFMVRREIKTTRATPVTPQSSPPPQPQTPGPDRPPARGIALHTSRVRQPAPERIIEVDRLELLDNPKEELHAIQKMIAAIEPESVDVSWRHNPVLWRKRLTGIGLALAALLVLLIQVAWLQFDRLNTVEPYRSFYQIACAVTGCTLSPMRDRSQIKTTNLYVRSHPDVKDALLIDVVMQNVAKFEQSFPSLILTFSNLKNEAIAERKFTPDEYLGGELSGSDSMPRLTPVHVELQIVDPGSDAVSYSIAIVD